MRTRLTFLVVAVSLICLLGGAVAAGSPAPARQAVPADGRVAVSVTVLPTLRSTFEEGGVVISSNVPWSVSAKTADGERILITGEPTAGRYIALPESVGVPEVCAR